MDDEHRLLQDLELPESEIKLFRHYGEDTECGVELSSEQFCTANNCIGIFSYEIHSNNFQSVVLSVIAIYFIYKLLLLLGTILTAPLVTVANVIYRIYHPPDFPISYYIFGNGLLSLFTFPFEYTLWIVYKVVAFVMMLPFDFLAFVIHLVLSIFSLFNTVILSVIVLKLIVALVSVYYFRNLVFDNIPLNLSEVKFDHSYFKFDQLGAWLSSWN